MKIGAVFGLATVMLVMLLGQSRVFYSMSRDGLLPKWASAIHPQFRTPWITTIIFGAIAAIMPAFFNIDVLSELVEYRAHCWHSQSCLRGRVGAAGAASRDAIGRSRRRWCHWCRSWESVGALYLMTRLMLYVDRDDHLAGHRAGDLFRLFAEAQQGAEASGGRRRSQGD